MSDLDAQLLAAHAAHDAPALIRLYQDAAQQAANLDAACFFLTQAYVFALEHDHADCERIRQQLVAQGREPE